MVLEKEQAKKVVGVETLTPADAARVEPVEDRVEDRAKEQAAKDKVKWELYSG